VWSILKLAEEHGFLEQVEGVPLHVGDKVEIIPSHGCTTINLHYIFHVIRDNEVEALWTVSGRGKSM